MAWGQIHSRPELCLGISPLFLTFPDVFPWNDGWEAGEHHVYDVPLYLLSCAPAILPAHKIHPAAFSKCPNHPPLSQFLTHFPEIWAALSLAGHWHTMATFACPEATLWTNCCVFVGQGQCTLKASCSFWLEVQNMRRLGARSPGRENRGFSHNVTHVHNPDSSFPGSNRMIFWRGFSTQGKLQITHHQQAAFGQVQQHLAYPVFPHLIRRGQNILTWNLCWDVDRWGLCFWLC